MIAEFYGLSGSGKSTLVSEIQRQSEHVCLAKNTGYYKLLYHARQGLSLLSLVYFRKCLSWVLREEGCRSFMFLLRNTNRALAEYLAAWLMDRKCKRRRVVLIDEGFIQMWLGASWFSGKVFPQKALELYLERIPRRSVYVRIECTLQEAMKRASQRPKKWAAPIRRRLDSVAAADQERFILAMYELSLEALNRIRLTGKRRERVFNADHKPEQISQIASGWRIN
jgi:adenylate kinase family enzyme